jgi:RNA polymerase sigma-70 factor, ECF subfamily
MHPTRGTVRSFNEEASLFFTGSFDMNLFAHLAFTPAVPLGIARPALAWWRALKSVNQPNHQHAAADPGRDFELFRLIGSRDRAAFAEFYDRHATRLYSVAQRILNDATEAQDVVQDVFMQIWEKAGQFDARLGQPSFWVVTLVRNKAIDRIRASQRRAKLADDAGAEAALAAGTAEPPHESLHGREKAGLIRSALVELPADQRHAIELAFFSGLTQHEISAQLSEPLGTIKARIRRGLLKLRDQLEGVL